MGVDLHNPRSSAVMRYASSRANISVNGRLLIRPRLAASPSRCEKRKWILDCSKFEQYRIHDLIAPPQNVLNVYKDDG